MLGTYHNYSYPDPEGQHISNHVCLVVVLETQMAYASLMRLELVITADIETLSHISFLSTCMHYLILFYILSFITFMCIVYLSICCIDTCTISKEYV